MYAVECLMFKINKCIVILNEIKIRNTAVYHVFRQVKVKYISVPG